MEPHARRYGLSLLFASACLGFTLEAAHALKLTAYLDVPLRRELLTWAHAHGVGLALVLLAYGASGIAEVRNVKQLAIGSLGMVIGFALASLDLHESDPGVAIALVPVGALLVLRALYVAARTAWRV
ncbi:MAG TPA: hypothetical protein VFX59_12170 [Polyangiales bacterium]|nr:hypothetical protein [Polyangiales bacterium]